MIRKCCFETTQNVLTYSNETKKRKFVETVELQIVLKNFDPSRDKRFSGTATSFVIFLNLNLQYVFWVMNVIVMKLVLTNIPAMTVDDLKKLNKDKKLVRKLSHQYDAFLASDVVIRQIPRILGKDLLVENKS